MALKNISRKKIERRKTVFILSCIVTFLTVYSLVLPAITIDYDTAEEDNGIFLNENIETNNADQNISDNGNAENDIDLIEDTEHVEPENINNIIYDSGPLYPAAVFSECFEDVLVYVEAPEGAFPENTKLVIREANDISLEDNISDVVERKNISSYKAVDIAFVYDGIEIEPLQAIKVSITSSFISEKTEDPLLVHIDNDGNAKEISTQTLDQKDIDSISNNDDIQDLINSNDAIEEISKENTLSFESDSFSVYVLVYTVDFHYEVDGKSFDYSMDGGNAIALSELLDVLNVLEDSENDRDIHDFINDIESLSFSDESLVKILPVETDCTYQELIDQYDLDVEYSSSLSDEDIESLKNKQFNEGDYVLISLRPFDSEELLTISLNNGEQLEIRVTDFMPDPNAHDSGSAENTIMNSDEYADVIGDGITIKLFDYTATVNGNDVDGVWGSSVTQDQLRSGTGVNQGRTLLFTGSGMNNNDSVSEYNRFKGSKDGGLYYSSVIIPGIVDNKLGSDNYPALSSGTKEWQQKDNAENGSLGYLFGAGTQDGVVTYSGAGGNGLTGLLQKNEDGYYYYSSESNYARLNSDQTQIQLYTDTYKKAASTSGDTRAKTEGIGFFPFTNYDSTKIEEKGPNDGGTYYNHQFGMSLSATFVYPEDGYLPNANGEPDTSKPMEFEFSGDDDVWVFVDGVLVLDLGGVHSPIRGNINFATGQVKTYPYNSQGTETETIQLNNFYDKIKAVNGQDFDKTPYSEHRIDFFYMERGGCDSNCSLSFNLLTKRPDQKYGNLDFNKTDENNHPVDGAEFKMFVDETCQTPLMFKDGEVIRIAVATSSDGHVSFSHIPVGNYYMKETVTPDGFVPNDTVYKVTIKDSDSADTSTIIPLDGSSSAPINQIINKKPPKIKVTKEWKDFFGKPSDYNGTLDLVLVQWVHSDDTPYHVAVDYKYDGTGEGHGADQGISTHSFAKEGMGSGNVTIYWKYNQWTEPQRIVITDQFGNHYENCIVQNGTAGQKGGLGKAIINDVSQDLQLTVLMYNYGWEGYDAANTNEIEFSGKISSDYEKTGGEKSITLGEEKVWSKEFEVIGDGLLTNESEKIPASYNNKKCFYTIEERSVPEGYSLISISSEKISEGVLTAVNKTSFIDITLEKTDKYNGSLKLNGASFVLKQLDPEKTGNIDIRVIDGGKILEGITSGEGENKGKLIFEGLENGYYQIKEKSAPAGYILSDDATFYFRITETGIEMLKKDEAKPAKEWDIISNTPSVSFDNTSVKVLNEPGKELPHTGGKGTLIYRTLGLGLIVLTGLYFIKEKRRFDRG